MTNEGQLPMMKNMLNSAMKVGFNMKDFHCYIISANKDAASYNTSEFKSLTTRKLEVILINMRLWDNVLWVDNDIVFFQNCVDDIFRYPGAFVMQDDLWGYCTGFFLVRPTAITNAFMQKCIDDMNSSKFIARNDQHVFNSLIKTPPFFSKTMLPQEEYPNGSVYFKSTDHSKAKMLHNNYLNTTAEKVQRFKDNGMWDESDDAFNLVNKYYM